MRGLANLSKGLALLAAVVLVLSLLTALWLGFRAETAQRVLPHDEATATLLGEVGTPVGDEQVYIVFDERAFLELPAGDNTEVRWLNETYLRENGIYPWQMKTVRFVRNIVLGLSAAAVVLFGGLGWYAGSRTGGKGARA